MNEIIFNGKGSSNYFDTILVYFKPQPPAPKIIKSSIPYMNGSYDFSSLYLEQSYEERKLKCKIEFVAESRISLYTKYNKILNWLITDNKEILEYTGEPGLYYMAKIENEPSWEVISLLGRLEFEFIAYPFKISKYNEGTIPWDDFNFELDYIQETKFDVSGSRSVNIINSSSKKITPTVICSGPINVVKNNITYKFNTGTTKDWRFILDKGENNLILNGNCSIEFAFRKEVL